MRPRHHSADLHAKEKLWECGRERMSRCPESGREKRKRSEKIAGKGREGREKVKEEKEKKGHPSKCDEESRTSPPYMYIHSSLE